MVSRRSQGKLVIRTGISVRCLQIFAPSACSQHSGTTGSARHTGRTAALVAAPAVLTFVAVLSLILVAALAIGSNITAQSLPKHVFTTSFMIICVFGAVAAVSPSRCSRLFHKIRASSPRLGETGQAANYAMGYSGHHPTCGSFSTHVLKIGKRTLCAGCLGLFTGALIAITGTISYSLIGFRFGDQASAVFWLGFAAVLMGLIQHAKPLMLNAYLHFLLNVVLVSGAFLLFVGIVEMNGDFTLQTYFLITAVFWILTRITLSNLEHIRACSRCSRKTCISPG